MSRYFTHLHLHTDYSLLDGAIPVDKVVQFAKDNGMPSIGISDHGNIFGAVKFFQEAKKAGIKPVLGMEAYVCDDVSIRDNRQRYYHLLLLVQNEAGYRNLCRLIHYSYTQGFYFKPRIDYQVLAAHSEGLIATTTCLGGHIPQMLLQDRKDEAYHVFDRMLSIFGEDRYYIEVQPDGQDEQTKVNNELLSWSYEKGIPAFATADCHYFDKHDRYAHEVMLAIQTRAKMSDANRMTFPEGCHPYMRTTEEMLQAFSGNEDVVWRAGEVADRCTFDFETGKLFFPSYDVPEQETHESYFTSLCKKGLQKRFDEKRIVTDNPDVYWQRLQQEMDLITSMGFVTYFLVVSDFIRWAKDQKIPVGPGRGSAAGSLVAWALDITDIDPIRYNLLFERFLNPERVTMPDIDIDFCIEGRERVISYVKDKYGHDKVCQIITFGTMMAKGVVKDVARALGVPFEDANALTDLIPDQLKITLQEAFEQEPRLQEYYDKNSTFKQLFDIAFKLEGLTRHASKHAAGLVITPEPIQEMLPVYVPSKTNDVVTQYAMAELESIGFLKMDFLGLKNLTLIQNVVDLIKRSHGEEIDIVHIPRDDAKAFELISRGDTSGVFQLESNGLKDVLRRLKPECFEDIIAVNALYRPGPLGSGMVEDYIERRHGRQEVTYLLDELEPILKETYGVILYQEQVMSIASTIADYSLGEADILRRAMGKKKMDVMAEQRVTFTTRAEAKGFKSETAGELFDLMAYFAGYGFNKSHSAAYGLVAYQTAYLKAHYPAEFMACLISLEARDAEKMAFYVQEAREMGIDVMPPDINRSSSEFSTEDGAIRFGLRGIKGIGEAALEMCLSERDENGPFVDMLDMCVRIDLRTCNKRVLEHFIYAGACDALPGTRAQKIAELGAILDRAVEEKKRRKTGQMGLFSNGSQEDGECQPYAFSPCQDWSDAYTLEREKEVLGVYISAQPLDRYRDQLSWIGVGQLGADDGVQADVWYCGLVTAFREITTKKGDKMAFVTLEDSSGSAEVVVFPRLYNKLAEAFQEYTIFLCSGMPDTGDGNSQGSKIKAQHMVPLEHVFEHPSFIDTVQLRLPRDITQDSLGRIAQKLPAGTSRLRLVWQENGHDLALHAKECVACTIASLGEIAREGVSISLSLKM